MNNERPLGELLETLIDYRGKTPPKSSGGIPLITAKVIKDGSIKEDGLEYVSEETYSSWMRRGFPKQGDILITTEAPLGEVAQLRTESRVALAQRVILLRADSSKVSPQFLFHFLRSPLAQERLRQRSSGTTVTGIRQPELRAVKVPYLPEPVQLKVGEILDDLDNIIENNRRRIALLEQMARAIYKEWFVNFRFPGRVNDVLASSVLGPIPEGWHWVPLGQLCDLVTSSVMPEEVSEDTPSVGLEHIPRKSFTLREWGLSQELGSRKFVFAKCDVLFGKIRPYFHKVSIAPMSGICSTDAIVLRAKRPELVSLVCLTAFSDEFVAHAVQTSNGTKMPRADWKVLCEWPVPIPSEQLLERFEDSVGTIIAHCNSLAASARMAASIRDILLPGLVTGRIDLLWIDLGT